MAVPDIVYGTRCTIGAVGARFRMECVVIYATVRPLGTVRGYMSAGTVRGYMSAGTVRGYMSGTTRRRLMRRQKRDVGVAQQGDETSHMECEVEQKDIGHGMLSVMETHLCDAQCDGNTFGMRRIRGHTRADAMVCDEDDTRRFMWSAAGQELWIR
eukprot:3750082-Rhodomonas_salina.1